MREKRRGLARNPHHPILQSNEADALPITTLSSLCILSHTEQAPHDSLP